MDEEVREEEEKKRRCCATVARSMSYGTTSMAGIQNVLGLLTTTHTHQSARQGTMPRSDDICVALQRPDLDRLISGALKNTIDAHGPITREWIGSATKRITSQLKGRAREQRQANDV